MKPIVLLLLGLFFLPITQAAARVDTYECGGAVEAEVWQLWDKQGRRFLQDELLANRLLRQKNPYALYDMQSYLHNLEAMAERCSRTDRLIELANNLMPVYSALESVDGKSKDVAWICRGGAICNSQNQLINKEVQLVSVQGLALFSALANALATSTVSEAQQHPFVARTLDVSTGHLRRWSTENASRRLRRLADARPEDVRDSSSALFFSDKELWQISIYASLAGIYLARPSLRENFSFFFNDEKVRELIRELLRLFSARVSLEAVSNSRLGGVVVADIDRGFWRLYADGRYAGYVESQKPAACNAAKNGSNAELLVKSENIPVVRNLGWDISHARRLVHALNALESNRRALQKSYALEASELPPSHLARAFAAQLVSHVWNGEERFPLFSNYWSGANGWYRVAYDNGTGLCNEGYPPFGLSASFATGGYAIWGEYYPIIGEIGRNVYELSRQQDDVGIEYTKKYFPELFKNVNGVNGMLTQLMFFPSLVIKRQK